MGDLEADRASPDERIRFQAEIWDACIFPGFKRANDLIEKVEPPEHLLHFTSAAAITKIIPDGTLRLSRAGSSNDPKELDHGIRIVREELRAAVKVGADDVIFGNELIASFEGTFSDGTQAASMIDPHVCCFTGPDTADLIAHWAMYGRDGAGFALKFKGKALDKTSDVDLVRIDYDETKQRAHMRTLLAIARETSENAAKWALADGPAASDRSFRIASHAFGGIFSLHAAMMKAPEFAAENEWRLIHHGIRAKSEPMLVEARGHILRSYVDMKFEPDDLASIVVGPVHADVNRAVLLRLLWRYGYQNTKLTIGKIALRTLHDD
jgi:hypothetical protein